MSQVWTATNIKLVKAEVDIPNSGGNKTVTFGFTSDIQANGTLHHHYNRSELGINPRGDIAEQISNFIREHLAFWDGSGRVADGDALPSVSAPVVESAPVKTQDDIDRAAWLALRADWQIKTKVLASGISKAVTQETVDDAFAAMKATYKDEYGAFLP